MKLLRQWPNVRPPTRLRHGAPAVRALTFDGGTELPLNRRVFAWRFCPFITPGTTHAADRSNRDGVRAPRCRFRHFSVQFHCHSVSAFIRVWTRSRSERSSFCWLLIQRGIRVDAAANVFEYPVREGIEWKRY
jgi:hypothetical protein